MASAIKETERRREIQNAHNLKYGITPQTITSSIKELELTGKKKKAEHDWFDWKNRESTIKRLEFEMDIASANLDFERAAELRDQLVELRRRKT